MSNKVSIRDIKAAVKANKQDTIKFTFGSVGNTIPVEFKPSMTLAEESAFVLRISNNVFDVNGNYRPEYFKTLFALNIIQFMSNLTIPKMKIDSGEVVDMEEFKSWDANFEFVDTILNYAESVNNNSHLTDKDYAFIGYIDHLENVVMDQIEYIKEQKLHTSKFDELCETLIDVVHKYDKKMENIDFKEAVTKSMEVFNKVKSMDEGKFATAIVDHAKKAEKKVTNIKDATK